MIAQAVVLGVRFVCLLGSLLVTAGCAMRAEFSLAAVENRIITASQWGGTPADEAAARKHSINRITLHHQGVLFPPENSPAQYLQNLQTWSRNTRKWPDIPYHYLIDLDGKTYEGRDIRFSGDTNTEYDPTGHALIELVGNHEVAEPSQFQLDATVELMTMLAAKYAVPVDAIKGHKDFSAQTVCPGKNLYRYLENGYFQQRVSANLATLH